MKRTTKIKMKRGKVKMTRLPAIKEKFGGHLPHPPKDCLLPHKIFEGPDGVYWIDHVICDRQCPSFCERSITYLTDKKQERKRLNQKWMENHPSLLSIPIPKKSKKLKRISHGHPRTV
jgi:hypothetical protein